MIQYSFLVCVYNGAEFLKACLDSLVNQAGIEASRYEVLVVNDGSTDSTPEILASYGKQIRIINQPNQGLSAARNTAAQHAKGTWVAYVDADDYVSSNLLATLDKTVQTTPPEINVVRFYRAKDQTAAIKDAKRQRHKKDDTLISLAVHRSLLQDYQFPPFRYAIEDWDFFVHNFHKMHEINLSHQTDVFYYYRYNPNSLSKAPKVYRSRLEHALSIFEDPVLRQQNLESEIIGHYYEHLYMMARLWFKDLLPRVKAARYQTKVSFSLKLEYWFVRLGLFNFWLRKLVTVVDA